MCGRYTGNDTENNTLREIYRKTQTDFPDVKLKNGEIFPTDTVPVLRGEDVSPFPASWGYPGFNGKGVVINARAETAAEKNMFRDSLYNRRCVVPTTGYLEWSKDKTKYRFNLPDSGMLYLGGFYKLFPDGVRFVILTTSPNSSVCDVHNRMPVILTPDMLSLWTGNTQSALNYLNTEMPALIKTACL